jgi:hypothetical protein
MDDRWFQTSSGRKVLLTATHLQTFSRGFLEGRPDLIRTRVLERLPDDVRRVFPGQAGVFVSPCRGKADEYPQWVVACEFDCSEPVAAGADCSSLIAVWFADDLSWSIPEFVAARIGEVDWELHAVDGFY